MLRAILILSMIGSAAWAGSAVPTRAQLAEKAARRFPQKVQVGTLLHRDVLKASEDQAILGHVSGVVREADGGIDAVIAFGGLFGIGARRIAVPIEAMVLVGPDIEVADIKPAELDGLPTFTGTGATPLPAEATISVGLAKPSH